MAVYPIGTLPTSEDPIGMVKYTVVTPPNYYDSQCTGDLRPRAETTEEETHTMREKLSDAQARLDIGGGTREQLSDAQARLDIAGDSEKLQKFVSQFTGQHGSSRDRSSTRDARCTFFLIFVNMML